jgi:hypothetical protein
LPSSCRATLIDKLQDRKPAKVLSKYYTAVKRAHQLYARAESLAERMYKAQKQVNIIGNEVRAMLHQTTKCCAARVTFATLQVRSVL